MSRLNHFRKTVAFQTPLIGNTFLNHNDNQPTIPFTVPLLDKQGALRAVLVCRHELALGKTFSSLINTRIGMSGYFYIFDTERHMVAHNDSRRQMETIPKGANSAIDAALDGFEGTMENVNSRGVHGLTSFKRLTSTNWILGVHHPTEEAYQPLWRSLKISTILLLLALLFSIFITRFSMTRMLAPLNMLTRSIREYQPGHSGERPPPAAMTNDEVGRLGSAYERMISKIEEQHGELRRSSLFIESLVMRSAAPVFVLDQDHRVLFWNQALTKLTGLKSEEMRGSDRHWQAFYPEQRPTLGDLILDKDEKDIPELYGNFRKSGLVEGAMQSEGWFRLPGLGKRFLYFHASPITDENGKIVAVVETLEDLTESKQTEVALRESEEKFRTISDSAQDAIIMIDNNGLVTFWNAAAEQIFGYSKAEILGRDLHELITPPAMLDKFKAAFADFRESGQGSAVGKTMEMPAIRKGGLEIPIEMSLSAVRLGSQWCAIGLALDITARKAAQEAIAASQAALEGKHDELKQVFNLVAAAKLEWEQTLDSLKDIIILTDADHRIRRCNRILINFTGKGFEAVVHQDWREVLSDSGFNFVTFDGKTGKLLHAETQHEFDLNIYEIHGPGFRTPERLLQRGPVLDEARVALIRSHYYQNPPQHGIFVQVVKE